MTVEAVKAVEDESGKFTGQSILRKPCSFAEAPETDSRLADQRENMASAAQVWASVCAS